MQTEHYLTQESSFPFELGTISNKFNGGMHHFENFTQAGITVVGHFGAQAHLPNLNEYEACF